MGRLSERRTRIGDAPRGVFYEKASNVKAALAAILIGSSELRSIPESSIRTLKEPFAELGA